MSNIALNVPKECLEAKRLLGVALPASLIDDPAPSRTKLSRIGRYMGVREIINRPVDVAGMVVPAGDGYVIVLNQNHPESKKLYTVAHELGHLVFAKVNLDDDNSENQAINTAFRHGLGNSYEERMCEALAAEILMPAEVFAARANSLGNTLNSVPRLAATFGTSVTATALRFWELLPEPALIIKWSRNKSKEGALIPDWQRRNEADGPRAKVLVHKGKERRFLGPESAYGTSGLKTSNEVLSTIENLGRKRVTEFHRYKTESMGFGSGRNRFVLSVGYLSHRSAG